MTDRPDPIAADPSDELPITVAQFNETIAHYERSLGESRRREMRYAAIHQSLADILPQHIFDPLPADPEKLDEYNQQIVAVAIDGMNFRKILKAIQEDESVKSQWDRLVMMIGFAE